MKNPIRRIAVLLTAALLGACGGGESSRSTWEVAGGAAQKGPLIRGSWVSVGELDPATLQPAGTTFNLETLDDHGRFDLRGIAFSRRHVEAAALGYYFDEVAGRVSTGMVTLRGLADLETDRRVNVNVLTDLSRGRVRALAAGPSAMSFGEARLSAQRASLARFYIYNSTDLMPGGDAQAAGFGELDLALGRDADLMLAAISAVLADAAPTPGALARLLAEFEADLADNGTVDNSIGATPPVASRIHAASRRIDWQRVATHLNRFYGTTRFTAAALGQWVDSSGGVDRVIDRFKHHAGGVPAGAEATSPEYVAGADDDGQCFSVDAGRMLRNGASASAPVRVSRGDVLQVVLAGEEIGATEKAFLRRSPPVSGSCPTAVSAASATRVAKWSITVANGIVQVAGASTGHSLAVMADGSLWAWGNNSHGQLGDGTTVNRLRPVQVGSGFAQVAAGVRFTVGIKRDGTLWTWGDNEFGALGDGTTTSSAVPRQVGTGFAAVSARGSFVAALRRDGTLWAWGANNFGQIGDGAYQTRLVPTQVGSGYRELSAGSNFVLARRGDLPGIWAWGTNAYGQLGLGTSSWRIPTPTRGTTQPVVQVSAGWDHSMALGSGGQLLTWGLNSRCQVGDGRQANVLAPKQVGSGFARVAAGGDHSVAVHADGTLWGWGRNDWGQAGDGTTTLVCTPKKIAQGFRDAAAGNHHTLALKRDGTLWAWGLNNFGQLGDGTTTNRTAPTQIALPPP